MSCIHTYPQNKIMTLKRKDTKMAFSRFQL